ncbi:toxin YdaT family protein [uncultured Pluralibacter sp.]|uniref:toxin YdaT family protein n=1 Tax=uncultured Pluralibacter sp. TaxID=1490864 RepID=UPI00262D5CEA|nr:toxin YdaT family protein [uncultured Pluralibacter sp.]
MQSMTCEHHNQRSGVALKTQNQFQPRRRDSIKCRRLLDAVRDWEGALPGKTQQDDIARLVAERWLAVGGRGITVNKQNLFRYLRNEGGSEKYTCYVMQLSEAIITAMPLAIAKRYGWRRDEKTSPELVASAMKECTEAHQAKLLGAPLQNLEKEIREAAVALFNMLPADAAGPLLASISAVAPQFF